MNVALSDYNDDTLWHVVELMKDSLRESNGAILENTWEVASQQRQLYKNEDGHWEVLEQESRGSLHPDSENIETLEILNVMTVSLTVLIEENI